jgi:hypothetical protein
LCVFCVCHFVVSSVLRSFKLSFWFHWLVVIQWY